MNQDPPKPPAANVRKSNDGRVGIPLHLALARLFLICFLLATSAFVCWRVLLFFKVSRQFHQLRSDSRPLSGEELKKSLRPLPDSQNGAIVLTQAFALVRPLPDSRSNLVANPELLRRTNIWSEQTRAAVEAYVQTNQAALAQARTALQSPRFRFSVDYAVGTETRLPHLYHLKRSARVLGLQAALEAEKGGTEWPDIVTNQLAIASTLDEEPIVTSHLVRAAIIRIAMRTTERCLSRIPPSAETSQALQAAFMRVGETNLLPQVFIGERAMLTPMFRLSWRELRNFTRDAHDEPEPEPVRYSGEPNPILWGSGLLERDLQFFLETTEQAIALAALPPPKNLALTNHFEAAYKEAARQHHFYASMLLTSFSGLVLREANTLACSETAATALAVERFRQKHGRLPASLQELTPTFIRSVPRDPFDGAPLRYRPLVNGYVIYSVGFDGHDDNGREPPDLGTFGDTNRYDLTFLVDR